MQPSCLGHRPIVVAVAKTSETSDIDSKTLFKTRRKNNHFFYTASSFNRKKTTFVSFVLSLDSLYTPSNIRVLVLEIGFWEKNTRRRKNRSFFNNKFEQQNKFSACSPLVEFRQCYTIVKASCVLPGVSSWTTSKI